MRFHGNLHSRASFPGFYKEDTIHTGQSRSVATESAEVRKLPCREWSGHRMLERNDCNAVEWSHAGCRETMSGS
jgi:hypothetical protein